MCKASRRTGNWYSRCSQHIRDSISNTHRNREPFQFRTCPGSTGYFRQPPSSLSGNPDSNHINCDPVGPGFPSYFACSNPSPSCGSPSRKHRRPGAVPRIISTSDALRNTGSSQSTPVSFPPSSCASASVFTFLSNACSNVHPARSGHSCDNYPDPSASNSLSHVKGGIFFPFWFGNQIT